MKTLKEIQNEVILKYRIKIDVHSKCWSRTHAHIKERRICKWQQKNSLKSTFTLFHEIGHIETTTAKMRRAEEEYYATVWAIDKFKEYGLELPDDIIGEYQRYILREIDRGKRRGGTGYGEFNLYKYAGLKDSDKKYEWAKNFINMRNKH